MDKDLDDLTTKCIRCGFCLEACPTYVLTGQETESPRGRIYLAKLANEGQLSFSQEVQEHLDSCLGCRGCETACPSGVRYGEILLSARELLGANPPRGRLRRKLAQFAISSLSSETRLKIARFVPSRIAIWLVSRFLGAKGPASVLMPEPERHRRWNVPPTPVVRTVWFFHGCVMNSFFARANAATEALLSYSGCAVKHVNGCCGALFGHNGFVSDALKLAGRLMSKMPGDDLIVVNSAGCGSFLKEYASLFPNDALASHFSQRVRDISEALIEFGLDTSEGRLEAKVGVHDACHLVHAQGIREQPRRLLRSISGLDLVEIFESDRCCGSAGIYNLSQPVLSRQLLELKWHHIERSGVGVVVTGNPGCLSWIRQAAQERNSAVRIEHTATVLADALFL